jgi:hypothetical protein
MPEQNPKTIDVDIKEKIEEKQVDTTPKPTRKAQKIADKPAEPDDDAGEKRDDGSDSDFVDFDEANDYFFGNSDE